MSLNADQLYALLPAIYRIRDAALGQPLYALFSVIAGQSAVLEENIRQLYDDQFIETCAPWVIPYIGDLVGSNTIYEIGGAATGRRAEVAHTIGYRRRKGTVLALEQVAMDVSGMPAKAVEYFKRLVTTESMRHVRPHHSACVDLRRGGELERIGSAFDTLNRTVDVRRIAPRVRTAADPDPAALDIDLHGGGRFNIPDVGVFLWRWKVFQVSLAPAFRVDDRRYMFSSLGQDMPLFNVLAPRESFSRLTGRMDVPQPIERREFHHNPGQFYGGNQSIAIWTDGAIVDGSRICCCDLSDGPGAQWGCVPCGHVAIDPHLGRIRFAADIPVPTCVQVSYYYGFPAEIGGGAYDRTPNLQPAPEPAQFAFTAVVSHATGSTLEDAVGQWNHQPPGAQGLIILQDFDSLDIDLTGAAAIQLPAQSQLWILSAQAGDVAGSPVYTYDNSCVTLRGRIDVCGAPVGASVPPPQAGMLSISGVWLSGSLHISGGAANIQLMDCTLVPGIALKRHGLPTMPGEPSIVVSAEEATLGLVRCITGPIGAPETATTRICSSIVDSGSPFRVAYAAEDLASQGGDLHIEDSTVIGRVHVRTMEMASNTIFLARRPRHDSWSAALWCSRRQAGCVRFCFLPASAIVPRTFRCLPPDASSEGEFAPQFVVLRYGHPSYALLSGDTPMAIWTGGDNGSQIGVYNFLQETQAVRNVQLRAPEYIPVELEAGIFLEPSRTAIIDRSRAPYGYGHEMTGAVDDFWDEDHVDLRLIGIGSALI